MTSLRARIGDLPTGRGVLGELISDARPLRIEDVGAHPASYGFPPGHPPMHSFLGVPIMIRGEAWGNLYLTEKEGGEEFDQADENSAVILADWAAIAIENARLFRDATKPPRRVGGSRPAAAGGDRDHARARRRDRHRPGARVGREARAGRWSTPAGPRCCWSSTTSSSSTRSPARSTARCSNTRVPIEGSISGQVLKSMRPERVADLSSRVMVSAQELGLHAESALLVPLVFRSQAVGILIAADKRDGPEFTAEDARLLESFAATAAVSVHTATSVAEDRLRHSIEASEQERSRWARELHDETLQGLGGLQMLLSSALRAADPDRLRAAVRDAVEQIGIEIANLRSLIVELRPAGARRDRARAGDRDACPTHRDRARASPVETNISLALEDAERLAPEVESTVYRARPGGAHERREARGTPPGSRSSC